MNDWAVWNNYFPFLTLSKKDDFEEPWFCPRNQSAFKDFSSTDNSEDVINVYCLPCGDLYWKFELVQVEYIIKTHVTSTEMPACIGILF